MVMTATASFGKTEVSESHGEDAPPRRPPTQNDAEGPTEDGGTQPQQETAEKARNQGSKAVVVVSDIGEG